MLYLLDADTLSTKLTARIIPSDDFQYFGNGCCITQALEL